MRQYGGRIAEDSIISTAHVEHIAGATDTMHCTTRGRIPCECFVWFPGHGNKKFVLYEDFPFPLNAGNLVNIPAQRKLTGPYNTQLRMVKDLLKHVETRLFQVRLFTARTRAEVRLHNSL